MNAWSFVAPSDFDLGLFARVPLRPGQAISEYRSKYEPFLSNFYNMNDKTAQCALVDQRRREIRNFGTKLKSACTGTSTEQVRGARDDIETFALTALNICGPQ